MRNLMNAHCKRVAHYIVRVHLQQDAQFLFTMLQLPARLQLGMAIDDLYQLLEATGLCPYWMHRSGHSHATLQIRLSDSKLALLACCAQAITLH